jgi:hypothetical protein
MVMPEPSGSGFVFGVRLLFGMERPMDHDVVKSGASLLLEALEVAQEHEDEELAESVDFYVELGWFTEAFALYELSAYRLIRTLASLSSEMAWALMPSTNVDTKHTVIGRLLDVAPLDKLITKEVLDAKAHASDINTFRNVFVHSGTHVFKSKDGTTRKRIVMNSHRTIHIDQLEVHLLDVETIRNLKWDILKASCHLQSIALEPKQSRVERSVQWTLLQDAWRHKPVLLKKPKQRK